MDIFSMNKPRLVSSAHGRIGRILIVFPKFRRERNFYSELLTKLINNLPPYTKIVIWAFHDKTTLDELERILISTQVEYFFYEGELGTKDLYRSKKCCILKAPKNCNYSAWIQDPFLVLSEEDNSKDNEIHYLVEPSFDFVEIDEDHTIANRLAELELFDTFNAPLIFHGGNLLCGDDFILIGNLHFNLTKKLLLQEKKHLFPSLSSYDDKNTFVKNVLSRFLGGDKQIIVIGDKTNDKSLAIGSEDNTLTKGIVNQPFIHIDMFVTLAGRTDNDEYVILVGDPIAVNPNDINLAKSMKKQVDKIAKSLRSQGFIIIRNPIPLTRTRVTKGNLYYCLYNNCIVEITEKNKTVWLPTFGFNEWETQLREFDIENIHLWKSLDFNVIELKNLHPFVINNGGIHCLVKFLNRID